LAALYSQLVFSANRATSDGLKEACSYLCNATGVISFLRDKIIPDMRSTPPEDMDPGTLECLELLLLAQAQECYWQRAVTNGLKDASIAKIAAMVSDYYSQAMDLAIKSDAISSEWIHHMTAKHHHFAAVAQFRASRDCLDKRKYGEEVARLKDAVACANEALREARYVNKTVLGDLNILKNKLLDDLQRAEKDNDIIYLRTPP
jgi:programmed cell death 6-interacting protein